MLADRGSAGEPVRVPYEGRGKPVGQKVAGSAHAELRGPGDLRQVTRDQ
ncbi:hypothetical protein [Sphaerimonospora mesophila]